MSFSFEMRNISQTTLTFSEEEFQATFLGGYVKTGTTQSQEVDSAETAQKLPSGVDWRKSHAISPVKSQGSCGSCWAFAAVEQTESYLALATGNMTILSPQELLSCMPNPMGCGGTGGCHGAIPEMAFQWIYSFGIVR